MQVDLPPKLPRTTTRFHAKLIPHNLKENVARLGIFYRPHVVFFDLTMHDVEILFLCAGFNLREMIVKYCTYLTHLSAPPLVEFTKSLTSCSYTSEFGAFYQIVAFGGGYFPVQPWVAELIKFYRHETLFWYPQFEMLIEVTIGQDICTSINDLMKSAIDRVRLSNGPTYDDTDSPTGVVCQRTQLCLDSTIQALDVYNSRFIASIFGDVFEDLANCTKIESILLDKSHKSRHLESYELSWSKFSMGVLLHTKCNPFFYMNALLAQLRIVHLPIYVVIDFGHEKLQKDFVLKLQSNAQFSIFTASLLDVHYVVKPHESGEACPNVSNTVLSVSPIRTTVDTLYNMDSMMCDIEDKHAYVLECILMQHLDEFIKLFSDILPEDDKLIFSSTVESFIKEGPRLALALIHVLRRRDSPISVYLVLKIVSQLVQPGFLSYFPCFSIIMNVISGMAK